MRKAVPTQVRLRVVISMGKVEIAVQAAWQFADGVGVGGGVAAVHAVLEAGITPLIVVRC